MSRGVEGETCAGFLRRMEPTVRWAAARHAAVHPYLGSDDLFQEAMEALVRAWRALYPMPPDDLARVGRQAILWRLRRARERARVFGEGDVVCVSTDSPSSADGDELGRGGGSGLHAAIAVAGDADCFFPAFEALLDRALSPDARAVLRELTTPGAKTLAAVRRARKRWEGRRGNWWRAEQAGVLGKGVGLSQKKVRGALSEIRRAVYRMVDGETSGSGDNSERRLDMGGERGFVPDDLEAGLPEAEKPAVVQGAAKAVSGSVKKKEVAMAGKKRATRKKVARAESSSVVKTAKPASKTAKVVMEKGRAAKADGVVVKVGDLGRAGTYREKIQSLCKGSMTLKTLREKAEAAKVPTAAWKINDMVKRGQLQVG